MVQFTNLDMKTDMVYKGRRYEWQFTDFQMKETVENIIQNILDEDVGKTINENFTAEGLKTPLLKMIGKKSSISDQFEQLVAKQNKKVESGLTVGHLVSHLLKKLIPLDLVGGYHNRSLIIKFFRVALKSGLKDAVPLTSFVEGLKTKRVRWLQSLQTNERFILMAKLVKWLWKVTKSLIASKYYVTEAQGSFKLIYIPSKIWQSRTDQKFNLMTHLETLKPLTEEEAKLKEAKRRPAQVRWLPKSNGGLRPIIFLKKDPNNGSRMNTQRQETELKAFLRFLMEKTKNPIRIQPQEIHRILKSMVSKLGGDSRPKVHLVTVDVEDAYGSIRQDKLISMVNLMSVQCFGSDKKDSFIKFNVVKKFKKILITCEGLTNATVEKSTDKVTIVKLKDLLERVMHIVKCQTIKRMKNSYLISKGISQAVPVSAALCNLYLSYFTKTTLSDFTANKEDALLRAMDDFLYITPDKDRAKLFLKKMSGGYSPLNIFIKKEKTQSTLYGNNSIDFYGFTFDTNLEVRVKYNNGAELPFRHTMTFTYRMQPIDILMDKMVRIPSYKLKKLTLDPAYTTVRTVCWNLFHTACLMACCFKATVVTVGSDNFTEDNLLECIRHSSSVVAAKTFRIRGINDVYKRELFWISVRAFFLCFTKVANNSNAFSEDLLKSLEEMEAEARGKVRLGLIEKISKFVQFLPPQFQKGC